MIRLAFIGCGRATRELHLPALAPLAGIEVAGLADVSPDAVQHAARQLSTTSRRGAAAGAPRTTTDYGQLLEDRLIDAVAICVPAERHVEIALAALAAGKHLFIEKPLALTLEDCDRLMAQAVGAPQTILLGFHSRWHRLVGHARAAIQGGRLGELDLVHSALTAGHADVPEWRRTRARGGGAMFEMAVHHFDLWRYLTGTEVETVSAYTRHGIWHDESAAVIARMRNGVLATLACAQRTSQNNAVEISGRLGSLAVSLYRFDGLAHASLSSVPGDTRTRFAAAGRFIRELPGAVSTLRHGGEWAASYRAQWRHFIECVERGVPAGCTLDDGRRALAVALAAVESAETGRSVSVERQ